MGTSVGVDPRAVWTNKEVSLVRDFLKSAQAGPRKRLYSEIETELTKVGSKRSVRSIGMYISRYCKEMLPPIVKADDTTPKPVVVDGAQSKGTTISLPCEDVGAASSKTLGAKKSLDWMEAWKDKPNDFDNAVKCMTLDDIKRFKRVVACEQRIEGNDVRGAEDINSIMRHRAQTETNQPSWFQRKTTAGGSNTRDDKEHIREGD